MASSKAIGATLSLGLFGLAFAASRGLLAASLELVLSALLLSTGVAWALSGRGKLVRLTELYLWVAFILSVNHLHVVANELSGWVGRDPHDVLRALSALHLLVVIACLWVLGAWSRHADERSWPARVAAGLFVLGAVVFWVGARTFPGTSLSQVQDNMPGHIWTSVSFLVATLITLAGLTLFTMALREAGDRFFSSLGLMAFAFGAVFWTLHLVFRLTVLVQAAQEWSATAVTPPWFEPWRLWAGWMFASYSVLAYIGLAAYGGALIRIGWLANWVGWICILAGFVAAPLGGLPLFIHIPLWIIGILLLRRDRPWPFPVPRLAHADRLG